MLPTPENIAYLRGLLGEKVGEGQTEADTLFTNDELATIIMDAPDLDKAAAEGWKFKAANFANLVNVTDGAASREFSDLMDNALAMQKLYTKSSSGATEGRARVGKIRRAT